MASLGEDALGRLAQNPRANRVVQGAVELKERVDDLTRRVRGLEEMEQRIERLEQRLERVEGGTSTASAIPESPATTTKSSGA